jgi:hypothetical protein
MNKFRAEFDRNISVVKSVNTPAAMILCLKNRHGNSVPRQFSGDNETRNIAADDEYRFFD